MRRVDGRLIGARLLELDLLREMRFDATLPNGQQHTVNGFLTVDGANRQGLKAEARMVLPTEASAIDSLIVW